MTTSIADIFEDYLESLQNLPLEIDQNMHELRRMDEEFQRFKDTYSKHRRGYLKLFRANNNNSTGSLEQTTGDSGLPAAKIQLEKDYTLAIQKQDQKIDLAKKMYDLVSRHIERIDSEMAKNDMGAIDWMGSTLRKSQMMNDSSWNFDSRKGLYGSPSVRKSRTIHSSRPNPMLEYSGSYSELDFDPNEPKYCYCNQVSFGDMVACDGDNCEKEWFHYACAGLAEPPVGKWYCHDCEQEEGGYRKKIKSMF